MPQISGFDEHFIFHFICSIQSVGADERKAAVRSLVRDAASEAADGWDPLWDDADDEEELARELEAKLDLTPS